MKDWKRIAGYKNVNKAPRLVEARCVTCGFKTHDRRKMKQHKCA